MSKKLNKICSLIAIWGLASVIFFKFGMWIHQIGGISAANLDEF